MPLNSTLRNDFRSGYSYQDYLVRTAALYSFPKRFPALSGMWATTYDRNADELIDITGSGKHLTSTGTPNINPINDRSPASISFGGSGGNDEWSSTDAAFDITGNESRLASSARGITMFVWLRPVSFQAIGNVFVLCKFSGTLTNRSYALTHDASGIPRFWIYYASGTADTISSSLAMTLNSWSFVACVLDRASTTIKIFHNGVWDSKVNASLTAIYVSTATLSYGARSDNTQEYQGYSAVAGICAAMASESEIEGYYEATAPLFGAPI